MGVLTSAANLGDKVVCMDMHNLLRKRASSSLAISNGLLNMHLKCGNLKDGSNLFSEMQQKRLINLSTWNIMISGLAHTQNPKQALDLFNSMLQEGLSPDEFTIASVLGACVDLLDFKQGKQIYDKFAHQDWCKLSIHVQTTLLDLYGRTGHLADAKHLFESLRHSGSPVPWNAMLSTYIHIDMCKEALALFNEMQQVKGFPNSRSYCLAITACANLLDLEAGNKIYTHAQETLLDTDIPTCNAMLNLFVRCGKLDNADSFFDSLVKRNCYSIVTWNTMLKACADENQLDRGLSLVAEIQKRKIPPSDVTYSILYHLCGTTGARHTGMKLHQEMSLSLLTPELYVALIYMYGRFGKLDTASSLFKEAQSRQSATVDVWSAIINAHGLNGSGEEALNLFQEMQKFTQPNALTFTAILTACSHCGFSDNAIE